MDVGALGEVCPRCGEELQPSVSVCLACGEDLLPEPLPASSEARRVSWLLLGVTAAVAVVIIAGMLALLARLAGLRL